MSTAAERRPGAPKLPVADAWRSAVGAMRDAIDRLRTGIAPVAPIAQSAGERLAAWGSVATPFGWAVLVGAALALGLGSGFGWRELVAASIVGASLLAVAVLFVIGRSAYRVRIELADARVVVGETAFGSLEVINPGRRRMPGAAIELPVGADRAAFEVPALAAGEQREEVFRIPTQRRAVLTLGPVRSVRRDPLGLLARSLRLGEPTELYVHPRTVRLQHASSGFLRDLEGLPTRDLSSDDVAFHALREYVPGDDLRHVHWKSTARTQTLMVRQFEETRRSQLAILLSTRSDEYSDAEEFELAVSVVGSLALQALREGKQVTVLGAESPTPAEHPRRLLDGLSAVQFGERAMPATAVARTVAREVPGASVVVAVFGSSFRPEQMRVVSAVLPPSARLLAVRIARDEQPSRRAVGSLAVLTVPDLDDLPRALARAEA